MGAETSASDLTEQTNPKPPSDVTEALLHQEIRSALARMSDAARFRAVREAVNTADETFVSAATSASPILSGMSAAEQSAAREKWRQRLARVLILLVQDSNLARKSSVQNVTKRCCPMSTAFRTLGP